MAGVSNSGGSGGTVMSVIKPEHPVACIHLAQNRITITQTSKTLSTRADKLPKCCGE